jgi:hypothetical protein
MRISIGSKGTSRNGGNIFHHNRLFLVASRRIARKEAPPPIEIAPIEIRNAVYEVDPKVARCEVLFPTDRRTSRTLIKRTA